MYEHQLDAMDHTSQGMRNILYPASLCFLTDAQALTNTGRLASKPQPRARQGNPCSKPLPYDMCTSVHNHRQIPRKTPSCHPSQVCSGATPCCAVKHINACLAQRTTQVNIARCIRRLDSIHSAVSSNTICLRLPRQDCLFWTAVLLMEST